MILTNLQVMQLYEAMYALRNQKDMYLPAKTGFKILRNAQVLEPSYLAIEELRQKIVLAYGTLNEDQTVTIPQEQIEQVQKELDDLASIENDLDIARIQLKEIEDLPLSLDTLNQLYLIIDGE